MKVELVADELGEDVVGGFERGAEVFGRQPQLATGAGELFGRALDQLLQARTGLRVERVEQLVEVGHRPGGAAAQGRAGGQRGPVVRCELQRDVAIGDAGQRRHPDFRDGARTQWRDRGFDVDRDERRVAVREHDVGDAADRYAADLDLVAAHEFVGFGQFDVVGGGAAAGDEQVGDDQHDDRERAQREPTRDA